MVKGLRKPHCEEQLSRAGLFNLERRQLRGLWQMPAKLQAALEKLDRFTLPSSTRAIKKTQQEPVLKKIKREGLHQGAIHLQAALPKHVVGD